MLGAWSADAGPATVHVGGPGRPVPDVVGDADRPVRLGPTREAVSGSASDRLLALLGR